MNCNIFKTSRRIICAMLMIIAMSILFAMSAFADIQQSMQTSVSAAILTVPTPKSSGFSVTGSGVDFTYLYDGSNYGIAAGTKIGGKDRWIAQTWLDYQPDNSGQLGISVTLGYKIPVTEDIYVTPLVGVMQALTTVDGTKPFKGVFGGSFHISF